MTHDNVIAIYAVEDDTVVPYLVMPLIDGPNLQQMIDRQGPLPAEEVLRIGCQIASGLAAAPCQRARAPRHQASQHAAGERCPACQDHRLRAGAVGGGHWHVGVGADRRHAILHVARAGGRGGRRSSERHVQSRQRALHALRRAPPFRARTTRALLQEICAASAPRIRDLRPELPDWLDELVAGLHAKRPADRLLSAGKVAELLGRGFSAAPETVSVPAAPTAAGRFV